MPKEDFKDKEQLRRFRDALEKVIGDTIKKPISARLGYMDQNGQIYIKVPSDRTDQPNKYYFHEAGGTGFQGTAFLQPGALQSWQIRYNAPIRLKKDPLSSEWEIVAVDSRYAQEFFSDTTEEDGKIYNYEQMAPGLLTSTNPPSMRAKVIGGSYRVGDSFRYIKTQLTIDWNNNVNLPSTNLKSIYILVQTVFETGALGYKYGAQCPSQYSLDQVLEIDGTSGTYLPNADQGAFRNGYIKLTRGMTTIQRKNIFPMQDYLAIQSPDAGIASLDRIVTQDGVIVIDDLTGNVVYA